MLYLIRLIILKAVIFRIFNSFSVFFLHEMHQIFLRIENLLAHELDNHRIGEKVVYGRVGLGADHHPNL